MSLLTAFDDPPPKKRRGWTPMSILRQMDDDLRQTGANAVEEVKNLVSTKHKTDFTHPLMGLPGPGTLGMVSAWHGSPFKFNKFSTAKIGSGEGAQAYGHGLYFTDKKQIADFYRQKLSEPRGLSPRDIAARVWQSLPDKWNDEQRLAATVAELEKRKTNTNDPEFHQRMDDAVKEAREGGLTGATYKVDLDVDDIDLLDWDAPIKEQSSKVKEALRQYGLDPDLNDARLTGATAYQMLGPKQQASSVLNKAGIKGIRYFDSSSRGKGEGSHNYVIFDDATVKHVNRDGEQLYGVAPPNIPRDSTKASMDPDEKFRLAAKAEGWSDAKINEYLASEKSKPDTSVNPRNVIRSLAQGLSFNTADEIYGALGGDKEEMRRRDKAFREDHPWVSGLSEVAGGLALPGLGVWKALGTGAKTIRGAVGAGAGIGGGAGVLTGAGAAEGGVGARAKAAVLPGLMGATLGGVLPGGAALFNKAFSPAIRSTAKLDNYIERSGGKEALRGKVREFDALGRGEEVMLGDLSMPLQQATDFAGNASEEAAEAIARIAGPRQVNLTERILDDITDEIGDPRATQIIKDLRRSTQDWAKGSEGFGGLRDQNPVVNPKDALSFIKLMNSPAVAGPWRQAKEVGLIGDPPPGPISFEVLHGTKRRLDAAIGKAYRDGMGDLGSDLRSVRDKLVEHMEGSVAGFKGINAKYHQRKTLEKMVEAGQKAFHEADDRGLSEFVGSLNTDQLAKFKEGMGSELIVRLRDTMTNRGIAKSLMDASKSTKTKLRIVFGGLEKAEKFLQKMGAEREMANALGALGGSATARRLAAQAAGIDPAEIVMNLGKAPFAPWSSASQTAATFQQAIRQRLAKNTASHMSPYLTTQGSGALDDLLRLWKGRPSLISRGTGKVAPIGFGVGAGTFSD